MKYYMHYIEVTFAVTYKLHNALHGLLHMLLHGSLHDQLHHMDSCQNSNIRARDPISVYPDIGSDIVAPFLSSDIGVPPISEYSGYRIT